MKLIILPFWWSRSLRWCLLKHKNSSLLIIFMLYTDWDDQISQNFQIWYLHQTFQCLQKFLLWQLVVSDSKEISTNKSFIADPKTELHRRRDDIKPINDNGIIIKLHTVMALVTFNGSNSDNLICYYCTVHILTFFYIHLWWEK